MQVPEPVFWVETGAAVLGVWGVWDLGSGLRRGYISGMLSTITYVFLCAWNGIYADAVINGWYTVMSVVGWLAWTKRTGGNPSNLFQSMTRQGLVVGLVGGLAGRRHVMPRLLDWRSVGVEITHRYGFPSVPYRAQAQN